MMPTRAKTVILAFSMAAMLATPFVEAARLGKGKSAGMRRSIATRLHQQPALTRPTMPTAQAPTLPHQKSGTGAAIAAGLAGATAGYIAGSAISREDNRPVPASTSEHTDPVLAAQAQGHQFKQIESTPWGTLAMLGLVIGGGIMLFRRKGDTVQRGIGAQKITSFSQHETSPQEPLPVSPIPTIGSNLRRPHANLGSDIMDKPPSRLPDGTETPYFLRQAKAIFLHLQNLNTQESQEEVGKYLTPDLFNAIRGDIASNTDLADFPQLDCELSDASMDGNLCTATVHFFGTVSEAVGMPTKPFSEYWHYHKNNSTGEKWIVAGIQQSTAS